MGTKTKLSATVLALIIGGATADKILDQFLDEKEGVRTIAYQDGQGIWSICRGLTRIGGKPVTRGLKLSYSQCKCYDAVERDKAIAWVKRNVTVPLSEPAIAGIASFCPYNIGPAKCFPSTFYKKLNSGDRVGACAEIKRWIFDGGKDCRIKANNCAGQPVRRGQESELTCWGIDQ
ncbi:phage lysozyme [Hafnia alvei ATCC 13337]|jgi:lysozyme|uniref:Lysozyme n=2 Tax=Hafniaceae TaxID=1903412 RepID=A0ABD3ZHH5_HAFAL|nr:phage lysozyme [Hafnia alvei ATCC 13337]RLR10592.1 lysozyme [Hafnia alvei ATCC 13337]TBM28748.1 lysozyme [Hafnia alvei]DAM07942.1 MAG TPA: lysozyme [Bacteriophage sp.]